MLVLVCYDIVSDHRRRRVAKTMEALGRRVQYSVFTSNRPAEQIAQELSRFIDPEEDNVRIHLICGKCEPKSILLGAAARTHNPDGFRII